MKSKIKKSIVLSWILCLQILFCACGGQKTQAKVTVDDIPKENRFSADAEYITYQYEELKEEAVTIAKVEVLDELSSENSLAEYYEEYGMVVRFCAVRSVRALEVYKTNGDLSAGDEFQVQECCAIYEMDGEYYQDTLDDTPPLQKGETYLLFLNNGGTDTMSGKPGIIGCENGIVELSQPSTNDEYFDVSVKAMVEYESDLSENEKENILQAEEIYEIDPSESEEQSDITLETGKGEVTVSIGIKEEEDGKLGISIREQ